ncbi:MAG: GDP-mannose 4,6-dehydratase [Immundisolibacteraceae bacterium]|nr:GDP-mannose 4,6-dehydratase [Immundisolibacteraceae bacterium]
MRWLITGGCGFIGINLVRQLLQLTDHKLLIIDNLSVGSKEALRAVIDFTEGNTVNDASRCHLLVADVLNAEFALAYCKLADIVVHLAANTGVDKSVANPRQDCEINVTGTFNYLEAARQAGAKRFVFASSGAPVGEVTPPIHEEMAAHPVSPYGASKLAGEAYCSAYYRTFGLETVALRFGNIYGPGSGHKSSAVAKFLTKIITNNPIDIFGTGNQTRDFIYIDDLVKAIYLAGTVNNIGGEIFQIASNSETTVNELVDKLIQTTSQYINHDVKVNFTERRLGDVERNYSDTSKAKKLLGWNATTTLEQGLKLTAEWFIESTSSY